MKIAIFGLSGCAKEVRDLCISLDYEDIVFIGETVTTTIDGFRVFCENKVNFLSKEGYKFSIGIGSPNIRRKLSNQFPELDYVNLIHPSATLGYGQLDKILIKRGNIICAGVRLTNNIQIGNFGIYNLNCTVSHDCIIEDFVTISSGANISGNVKLSMGSYIGANACILQGKSLTEKLVIGESSTIGAGGVVTKNVPNHTIVTGVPAK